MYKATDIYYMITTECNQRCTKCSHWKNKDNSLRLPTDKLLSALINISTAKEFCIVGGEPTLFKNEIYDVLAGLSDTSIRTTVITNGVLTDKSFIDKIADYNIHIVFSIDTMDKDFWRFVRGVDSYDTVFQNLEYAVSVLDHTKISIQSVLSKETKKHIEDVAEYTKLKDIYHYVQDYLSDGFNGVWSEIEEKQLIASNNEQQCFSANRNLSIMQNGDVFTCFQQSWINDCSQPLGNLNTQEIHDLLTSDYATFVCEKMKNCDFPCKVLKCNTKQRMEFEEIIIELSHNCNLSCTMCGYGKDKNPFDTNKFLSFEKYKMILRQVGHMTKTVRLNGRGESTIHPNFIEIVNYTKQNFPQLNINLFSNLSFNNHDVIEALIANDVQLFISMDSPDVNELSVIRKRANFHFIENNLKRLEKTHTRPFIVFTIQEMNMHRIFEMARFAFERNCHILYNTVRRDEGIETFINAVIQNSSSITDQFEQVRRLYDNSELQYLYPDQLAGIEIRTEKPTKTHGMMKQCPALDKELCILYDGTVTPCNMFNPYVYGNVFDQSLNEIWDCDERNTFLRSHKSYYYCQNCANLGV